jgi:crotonobetainyl-CoA:carnitine CoA-transferase CaiB-like acyl-CoA transferase
MLVNSPMKLSATPVTLRRAPPLLGQHTDEVLREIGIDDDRLRTLRERHVI